MYKRGTSTNVAGCVVLLEKYENLGWALVFLRIQLDLDLFWRLVPTNCGMNLNLSLIRLPVKGIFTSQTPGNVGECRERISEMSPLRYFGLMLEEKGFTD